LWGTVSTTPTPSVPAPEPPAQAARPERLGAYELLAELAAGGMATVHLARATDHRQGPALVAIKRPHRHLGTDRTFVTMLVDEARLASAIDHPNVVKVRELGFDGGMPFIVMDYVEGASLAELRRELGVQSRALDVRVGVRMALDALAGLHAAHELRDDKDKSLQIIHRDVSPHNVLIGCDGRSYITDFGIAKAEDRVQTTRTHEVKGKLAYLAPERVDKRRICTVQSDVFSMAVVMWECFAGRRLFRGDEAVDILQEVMSSRIPLLRDIGAPIPSALDDVIARALSRDLDTRYATALQFAQAVERAVGPAQIATRADVARLMEAVFGARMAARQEQVRATIGRGDLADLLRESGLKARARSTETPRFPTELAPPAPVERYARGTELRAVLSKLTPRRLPWRSIAVASTGAVLGVVATLWLLANRAKADGAPTSRAPTVVAVPAAAPGAETRKVVFALPFACSRITIDDGAARTMDPPTDVVALDLPAGAPYRHHVLAVAPDGTRAEGDAREDEGIARAAGDGYAFTPPPGSHDEARRVFPPNPAPPPRVGTVHNGFTKLR
jgi:serine/threonine-protein kinase